MAKAKRKSKAKSHEAMLREVADWLNEWGNPIQIGTSEQCDPWPLLERVEASLARPGAGELVKAANRVWEAFLAWGPTDDGTPAGQELEDALTDLQATAEVIAKAKGN